MFASKDFLQYLNEFEEIGYVDEVISSIVHISGLPNAKLGEIIIFETGEFGQVISLTFKKVEAIFFSELPVKVGTKVTRTNQKFLVPVGDELLGNCIDPLGFTITTKSVPKKITNLRPVDIVPTGIETREKIKQILDTGVTTVDMMIPIGKGQRQLVIGDRKTGKTDFLRKAILNQAKQGTICIYTAIGQKKIDIKKLEEFFIANKVMENIIIVASNPQEPIGRIYITPYTAMTIAEYFRDSGRDVMLVLDDLTTHAKFYREIALLGGRFPGRNSYPGDIFYTHAKLLERAGNFKVGSSEVSITCFPVVETTQGDLSGYIQTNIMSMTDGHIYFDSNLFAQGRRPAINTFLSVTRVGHQTQSPLSREINRELTSFLNLFDKMQNYVHFGAELSESIKHTLAIGEKIINFFDQETNRIIAPNLQIFLFCLLWNGLWQDKSVQTMISDMEKIMEAYDNGEAKKKIDEIIQNSKSFNELLGILRKEQTQILQDFKIFQAQPTPPPPPVQSTPPQPNVTKDIKNSKKISK
ncbi:MAG: hypothetical protein ABIC96_04405 [Patescibacteria group bacterium]